MKTANEQILSETDLEVKYTVELLEYGDVFMASQNVCRLIEVGFMGVVDLFGFDVIQFSTKYSNISLFSEQKSRDHWSKIAGSISTHQQHL